jgi:hypothetical protein
VALLIKNLTRNAVLAYAAEAADTSQKRRTGLLKHSSLPEGQGLWIVPCEAVHTFGMNFPIDVIFVNRKRVVVKIRENMPKRRIAICLKARGVLELPAGMAAKTGTQPGDQLEFSEA